MRRIDQFYDTVRHGLFETFGKKRDEFVVKLVKLNVINGHLVNQQLAADIIEEWNKVFPDDCYPTDYWAEKWILLKHIICDKRKRKSLGDIFDHCMRVIGQKCERQMLSKDSYECELMRWE